MATACLCNMDPFPLILQHDKDLRLATEVIRNGAALLSSQAPSAERNNFVTLSQVSNASGSLIMSDKEKERQRNMDRAIALWQIDNKGNPLPPLYQKYLDMKARKEDRTFNYRSYYIWHMKNQLSCVMKTSIYKTQCKDFPSKNQRQ